MKTIIEMAEEVGALGYVRDSGEKPHQWIFTPKELERFAALVFEQGRQEGMKQERALRTLSRLGQEIEAQPERTWVGLTDEERITLFEKYGHKTGELVGALEDKLKEKNT